MEKKKESRRSAKLIVVLMALLLVACSLLGVTLARYVTTKDESQGGVNIAYWNIADDGDLNGTGDVRATLSPNMRAYTDTIRTRRVTADGATALVITNNSAVKAAVTLKITDGLVFYSNTAGEGGAYSEIENGPEANPEWENVSLRDVISFDDGTGSGISVTYGTGDAAGEAASKAPGTGADLGKTIYRATLEANGGWMKVSLGSITWTSDFDGTGGLDDGKNIGKYGDLRDTWIGQNVNSVGFAYSWEAVQASELPETGGTSNPTA